MATVTLNRKTVENLIGKNVTRQELEHSISYLGTDLESVGDSEIVVEIFPNRPDLLSEQGLGRALAGYLGKHTGLADYPIKKSDAKVIIDDSVKEVRPWTACAIVEGLSFTQEHIRQVIQMQEKLHMTFGRNRKKVAIGIYPLDKITWPVQFVGKKPKEVTFLPLESSREMDGLQILSQHPTGREYGHLLEGHAVFPFFIDAAGKVLSMPPIINSHDVGKIEASTKDVFIECSGANRVALEQCLNIIVTALADMGGAIKSVEVSHKHGTKTVKRNLPNLTPATMTVTVDAVNERLGLALDAKAISKLLERMRYGATISTAKKIAVQIPAYRTDILHPVDLIEDIAIAYGYDQFVPVIPERGTIGQESRNDIIARKASELLVGLGITEVNSFVISPSASQSEKVSLSPDTLIMLKNPSTSEYDCLRSWLIPSLLDTLFLNKRHEYPQNIFLSGRCAKKAQKGTGHIEEEHLGVTLCSDSVTFTDIKQTLDYLFNQLGLEYSLKPASMPTFLDGRCASIHIDGQHVGLIGEIHPKVLENFSLTMPVAAFDITMDSLVERID